jgi:8-oxo-dGTP pyrophosphatase MutT (NUDIX family)
LIARTPPGHPTVLHPLDPSCNRRLPVAVDREPGIPVAVDRPLTREFPRLPAQKSANPLASVGGNVDDGEDFRDAAIRELGEELGLAPEHLGRLELIGMADARVTRPGPTPSPRKIHLIYRTTVTHEIRAGLATEEFDELPGGRHDIGTVEWIDYRRTGDLPLFPPIGKVLAQLPSPAAPLPSFELEPVTDADYTWI